MEWVFSGLLAGKLTKLTKLLQYVRKLVKMKTFIKNDIVHRTYYDFIGMKRNGKCVFNLQIKGRGWKQIARGRMYDYEAVIYLLKTNDFKTHEEARDILIKEKFLF